MPAYDLQNRKAVPEMPEGTTGEISLNRIVEKLTADNEFGADQIVTHLEVHLDSGMVRYRLVAKE